MSPDRPGLNSIRRLAAAQRRESALSLHHDEPLWSLLDRTRFAIARLRELELAQFGLTIEQSAALKIIASHGGSSNAGELEHLTMRQPNTVSTLISRMARVGLVSRQREGTDRRYTVSLTEKGSAILDRVTQTSFTSVFSCLSTAENRELTRLLRVIQKRARSLLRVSFIQLIVSDAPKRDVDPDSRWRGSPMETAWTVLDGTRFVVARLRELELGQFGLTLEQSAILEVLSENGGSADNSTLVKATLRQHHTISTIVNRMIRSGLLVRQRKPGESRTANFLTPAGKRRLDAVTSISIDMAFSSLKTSDKERLERLLRRLDQTARGLLDAAPKPTSTREPKKPGHHSTP